MNQFAVNFASPLLLLGLIALVGPWLAHLLTRQTGRRVVFPTTDLLVAAQGGSRKVHRMRRRLLMLVRMLIIAMVVLAFAQPQVIGSRTVLPGQVRQLVVILDSSASMQQQRGGRRLAEEARAAALRAGGGLREGVDLVTLVEAGQSPRVHRPSALSLATLKSHLLEWQPSDQGVDAAAAFAEVIRLAAEHDGPSQVVLITDGQSNSLWEQAAADVWPAADEAGDLSFTVAVLADEVGRNFTVGEFVLQPGVAVPRQSMQLIIPVKATGPQGDDANSPATVAVEIDGRLIDEFDVTLNGSEQHLQMPLRFDSAGQHVVRVAIDPPDTDSLPVDNSRTAVVNVSAAKNVLLATNGDPEAIQRLALAMMPAAGDSQSRPIHADVAVKRVDVQSLPKALAAEGSIDVVVLPSLRGVTPAVADALRRHVQRGGGVMIWLGPESSGAGENAELSQLLPLQPGAVQPAGEVTLTIDDRRSSGPFSKWGAAAAQSLQRLATTRHYALSAPTDDVDVWMTYADEASTPVAVSRVVGRGRVLMLNLSPQEGWTNLGDHLLFPSMVQSSLEWVARARREPLSSPAGQPLMIQLPELTQRTADELKDAAPEARVITPLGDEAAWRWSHGVEGSAAVVDQPTHAGIYRVMVDQDIVAIAAVHVPDEETDLTAGELDAFRPAENVSGDVVDQSSLLDEAVARGEPLALWPWCLVLAAILLAVESVITSKLGRDFANRIAAWQDARSYPPIADATLRPAENTVREYEDEEALV